MINIRKTYKILQLTKIFSSLNANFPELNKSCFNITFLQNIRFKFLSKQFLKKIYSSPVAKVPPSPKVDRTEYYF